MNTFNAVLCVLLILAVILLFFFVVSNVYTKSAGVCCFFLVLCVAGLCFVSIKKNIVLETDSQTIKIINISFKCPECGEYIPSIDTKYCGRCGKKLDYIKKSIKGK